MCNGDYVFLMDADMSHHPKHIPEFIAKQDISIDAGTGSTGTSTGTSTSTSTGGDIDIDIDYLCQLTEVYSGADIHILCREAVMVPMRKILNNMNPSDIASLRSANTNGNGNGHGGCSGFEVPNVEQDGFLEAIANTKPSVGVDTIGKYATWMATYGSS